MKAAKITIESRLASVKEAEAPGTEKGQTVTIGRGGNVTITGQNPGESAETKTYDCPDRHLEIPSEKAEEILNLLGAFFGESLAERTRVKETAGSFPSRTKTEMS